MSHFVRDAANALREAVNSHLTKWTPFDVALSLIGSQVAIFVLGYSIRNRSWLFMYVTGRAIQIASKMPGVSGIVQEEKRKIASKMEESFSKAMEQFPSFRKFPTEGMPAEEVLKLMKSMKDHEKSRYTEGRISGTVYVGNDAQEKLLCDAYALFSLSNPLHPDTFPTVRKMEAEVVSMALEMLRGPQGSCGNITTGGTESILMAMKAYRDSRPDVKHPEIIVPVSAHAAFHKAGHYFGIRIVAVEVGSDFKVDVKAVERAINSNTIALVGSAVSFPQGVIDPIEDLAAIARKHNLGLHVDGCLGGFILPWLQRAGEKIPPFDFSVDGVTTMSADTHKYGMASKGTSVVLFRTAELRRCMYFVTTEWTGGLYASPTVSGSRPGALIAGAWAMMIHIGQKEYISISKRILEAAREMADGVRSTPGLRLLVDPIVFPIVVFESTEFDTYKLIDAMHGWELNVLQRPRCLHICLTNRHAEVGNAKRFVNDLRHAVEAVRKNPNDFKEKAPIYGMAATMPDRTLIRDVTISFLDAMTNA